MLATPSGKESSLFLEHLHLTRVANALVCFIKQGSVVNDSLRSREVALRGVPLAYSITARQDEHNILSRCYRSFKSRPIWHCYAPLRPMNPVRFCNKQIELWVYLNMPKCDLS